MLYPPPTRTYALPSAAEPDEEWSPDFRNPLKPDTGIINKPGLAEIKPHKAAAIRKGLRQLWGYIRENTEKNSKVPTEPKRDSVWLITYLPSSAVQPSHLRVFAHEIDKNKLMRSAVVPGTKGARPKVLIPKFETLVLSRRELPQINLPKTIGFPKLDKPDFFGLAVEDLIRKAFRKAYARPLSRKLQEGRKGADILWNELAGLFRELAEETGDPYWRELSAELTAGV